MSLPLFLTLSTSFTLSVFLLGAIYAVLFGSELFDSIIGELQGATHVKVINKYLMTLFPFLFYLHHHFFSNSILLDFFILPLISCAFDIFFIFLLTFIFYTYFFLHLLNYQFIELSIYCIINFFSFPSRQAMIEPSGDNSTDFLAFKQRYENFLVSNLYFLSFFPLFFLYLLFLFIISSNIS